jgi:teichoic acid transport system ATP-binding protein
VCSVCGTSGGLRIGTAVETDGRIGDDDEDLIPGDIKIIVDDLHVVYQVWTTPRPDPKSAQSRWRRSKLTGWVHRRPVPTRHEVEAVRGVSLIARQGEAIGVIGKNGSGKSTLMRAIAGLLPPASGHVYAAGQPTLLGVSSALIQALPGSRNIELGLLALGMQPDEIADKYQDIVEFSGIGEAIHMPMRTYSSGMGARLKFAIASSVSHEILLIDEALATGDGEFLRRSSERIQQLRDEADTIFLVSHSMSSVRATCDRVIWLDEGKIIADGDPEDIIVEYEQKYGLQTKKARKERRRKRRDRRFEDADTESEADDSISAEPRP